jgi:hypothetical protein
MPIEMVWTLEREDGLDLKQFASGLLERAKEHLQGDGYVQSAVFLVTSSEVQCYSVSFAGSEEKDATYREVVQRAREVDAHAIITLNDAYVGDESSSTGYEWGQIAKDPKGECLFLTVSEPGLENWTKEIEYRREHDGIVFSPPTEELNSFIGMLGDGREKANELIDD